MPWCVLINYVQTDCRSATARICQTVLGRSDYQLGHTKVFLKDAHDLFLEQERDRVLTRKILILQRSIRGWVYRRRYQRHLPCLFATIQFISNQYLGNSLIHKEIWTWNVWAWLLEVWPLMSEQLEWCLLFSHLVMYMGLRWSHHTCAVYSLKQRVFICRIFCGQNVVESFSKHVLH